MPRSRLAYAVLSIGAALVTMALKLSAYALTGSVSILSDALESIVNLVAAIVMLWALWLAAQPADAEHTYGHSKAEYFSSGVEGALIFAAALLIVAKAVPRLLHPQPLEHVGIGLLIALLGAAVNGVVAFVLWRAAARLRSSALRADALHLLTDVWTTGGVLVGVALVGLTGWLILDPLIALVVAVNIVWTGWRLIRESGLGLLDTALPAEDLQIVSGVLSTYQAQGIAYHALRTRRSGTRRFISLHILVPGAWTVQQGHDIAEEIELALRRALPETTVFTHLEPREDVVSFEDQALDREVAEI